MMAVGLDVSKYNTLNTFGSAVSQRMAARPSTVKNPAETEESIPALKNQPKTDTVDIQTKKEEEAPKERKTVKDRIADVWKFFTATGKMIGATAKGIFYGAVTGVALLGGSWLFKSLPQAFAKEGPTLWNTIRHPLTHIGKSGKIIAGVGGALVFAYHLIAGKLRANKATADVDHQLKTGHRNK